MKILGISGSLRKGSYNKAVLRTAAQMAPQGAEIEIFDLEGIPPFNQDLENVPPTIVAELRRKVREADAILFAVPEHNYTVAAVLMNALAWASRPWGQNMFDNKPVGMISASVGALGGARAQYHLRQSFVFLNMHPLNGPEVMISFAQNKFDEKGVLIDPDTKEHIRKYVAALVEWTEKVRAVTQAPAAS
jgi:chromate reductase